MHTPSYIGSLVDSTDSISQWGLSSLANTTKQYLAKQQEQNPAAFDEFENDKKKPAFK